MWIKKILIFYVEVEWIIAKTGAIKTTLEEDPRKQMIASRKFYQKFNEDSEDSD